MFDWRPGGDLGGPDHRVSGHCPGFTVQAWAQRYTTSTRTALIYLLEPVFAWITSYLLVGEGLSAGQRRGGAHLGRSSAGGIETVRSRQHPS